MKPPVKITMGPEVPAVAIARNLIVAIAHVAHSFTTARITTMEGAPAEEGFVWEDRDGQNVSVERCNRDFRSKIDVQGMLYCTPWREIPENFIWKQVAPAVGMKVQIDSRRREKTYGAKVTSLGNGGFTVDWTPQSGDSGSLVYCDAGFLGFAAQSIVDGTIVYSPVVAATPAPPPPSEPQFTIEEQLTEIRNAGAVLGQNFRSYVKDPRYQALAITALEDALLRAQAGIAPPAVLKTP